MPTALRLILLVRNGLNERGWPGKIPIREQEGGLGVVLRLSQELAEMEHGGGWCSIFFAHSTGYGELVH